VLFRSPKLIFALRGEHTILDTDVAASRARDRLILVRSVKREELNENDLKAKLIAHFENSYVSV